MEKSRESEREREGATGGRVAAGPVTEQALRLAEHSASARALLVSFFIIKSGAVPAPHGYIPFNAVTVGGFRVPVRVPTGFTPRRQLKAQSDAAAVT
eukprot:528281-Hanusia_phi.AAC.1